MADKLFCAHCDMEFVADEDGKKPRCTKCMRRGGVVRVSATDVPSGSGRSGLIPLALILVLAGVGYGVYRANTVTLEETPPLRPLEPKELAAYLERDQLSVGHFDGAFSVAGTGDWPTEPEALASAIRERTTRWGLDRPLTRDVYTASETLGALSNEDGEKVQVYPLEAALAMAAWLREHGTPAIVVETWDLGEPSPPDPSGRFGYFLVGIDEELTGEPSVYYDPWGGRGAVKPIEVRPLRDTEVIGAALATDAIRSFVRSANGAEALPSADTALRLDPVSPTIRGVNGTILIETGGVTAGSEELEAARELRPDGPRELNLVQLSLATSAMLQMAGEDAAAERELSAAAQTIDRVVDRWPRYARAYRIRAMMYFGIDQPERAREALEVAQSLDPSSASLWMLWSQFYLADGDVDLAAARARRAVELDPENWQMRLQVARVLVEAGDRRGAKEQTDAALALVPPSKRDELKRYLDDALSPTPSFGGPGGRPPQQGGLALDVPGISDAPGAPVSPQEPGLMLGDPSNLRLRDPDQDLQLDLDN